MIFADMINGLPRKLLGYRTPEELFDAEPDRIYLHERRALVIWRTVSEDILKSNAALDAYFTKHRINPLDREYDVIYVNGDNNLENLRTDKETWRVQMTETEFKKRMFEEE